MSPVADTFGAYLSQEKEAGSDKVGASVKGARVAIKDLIVVDNQVPSTAASKFLESFESPYDATVIRKLLDAGAVLSGKTNLDEFAMGTSTENSALGKTSNPWDQTRVPGGSSGGSAAAVAGGLAPLALGTDTGGSVRQPAALCGIVGFKPTYGRVSRCGVMAVASSLDQVGGFARSVKDVAVLMRTISGHDPKDATTVNREVPDYPKALTGDVKGLKVGLPKEYFIDGMQVEVEKAVRQAAADLKAQGAEIIDISLPHTKYGIAAYYIIQPSEMSANMARYDGIRYGTSQRKESLIQTYVASRSAGFGPEVKRRIMLGAYALSAGYYEAYYKKAMQVRTLIKRDFERAFEKVDVILTPTTPTTAFKIGEKADDPLELYLNDVFTVSANLAGLPGISLPCGFDRQGLPVGLQLVGPQWGEETILRAADAYEKMHDWPTKQPKEE